METNEYRAEEIARYVEIEASPEVVSLAERVLVESVLGQRHEIWNVHTDVSRYWVVTDLTNLYSQDEMPSHHMAFNVHLGLMLRLHERDRREGDRGHGDEADRAWTQYSNAATALANAEERADFQAVGMRCRETLLTLSRELRDRGIYQGGPETQDGNFLEWSRDAVASILPGSSNERMRRHLRDSCVNAWNLSAWLTHYRGATYFHAEYTVEAVQGVLTSMSTIALRHKMMPPEICPECGSYQVESYWLSKSRPDDPGVVACANCDWERVPPKPDH